MPLQFRNQSLMLKGTLSRSLCRSFIVFSLRLRFPLLPLPAYSRRGSSSETRIIHYALNRRPLSVEISQVETFGPDVLENINPERRRSADDRFRSVYIYEVATISRCTPKMFARDYVVKTGKWMTFVALI